MPAAADGGAECFIVPIDACYELVGHLRRLWRGFDGGTRGATSQLDDVLRRRRERRAGDDRAWRSR